MLETVVENRNRTVRGNRTLILVRLLVATIALALLLLHEFGTERPASGASGGASSGGEVSALIFGPEGKLLYSGASDATVRTWDFAAGEPAGEALEGHYDIIRDLRLSPDRTRLASACDRHVRIFDLKDSKQTLLQNIDVSGGLLRSIAWSPEGERLAGAGMDVPLRIWDTSNGKLLKQGPPESRGQIFAAYLPGGDLVTAGHDGKVRLWKVESLELLREADAPLRSIEAAALSPDGKRLAMGGRLLAVWDLEAWQNVFAAEAHRGGVNAMDFSGDGRLLLTGGSDRRLLLWDLTRPRERIAFGEHDEEVLSVALSPDGTVAASGTGDRLVRTWDAAKGTPLKVMAGHKPTLRTSYWQAHPRRTAPLPNVPLYLRPEGLVVVIVCGLTILYSLILRRKELAPKLAWLQILVDIGLISALVYHTGGVDSPFVTLYLVSVASAAFVLSWRGALLIAATAATVFGVVTLAYGLGHIPESLQAQMSEAQLRKYRSFGFADYVKVLLLPVAAFFLIALLAGNLAQRLAVARLLHHEVLEGIGEGILVTDLERRVLYRNREVGKLLAQNELDRQRIGELLGPAVDAEAARVLAETMPRRMETTHRRRDGIVIPFEVRLIPVLEEDGPPRGLIVVVDDITAEKKMEEFFKHKERLEAMGQISASIAHEIRNPLASIRGAVQEIARSVEIPEAKKILVDIVLSESDRLDQIISDFLRYARMRPPKLAQVDILQLLADLRLLLINRPEAKDMEIKLESDEEIEAFLADAEQIRQAILNLGVNAMQALEGRPEKRVTIRVSQATLHSSPGLDPKSVSERTDRPGVNIEIEDSGCGMPADVARQIFEPFYTTKTNGTGLGLAIVNRIVQAHEGMIGVKSDKDKGTVFYIWLPTDREPDVPAEVRGAAAEQTSV